jgi:hypothetical protein
MSRQMKNFADYFMQGMQLGAHSAETWEARRIARENAKLKAASDQRRDDRERLKLGMYGRNVDADIALKAAKAHRLMNPVAKGGGGGGSSQADVTGLLKEASEQNIISSPAPPPPAAPNITINQGSNDGTSGADADASAPPGAEVETDSRGGMVGSKRYAEGGIVEGMSLEQAQSYGTTAGGGSSTPKKKPAASPFASASQSAAGKYKAPEEKTKEEPKVSATGPVGTGPGGSYTTADTQSGGALDVTPPGMSGEAYRYGGAVRPPPRRPDTNIVREPAEDDRGPDRPENDTGDLGNFRRGGKVRRYQSGGRVMEAIDTGTSGPGSGYGYRAAPPARR